MQSLRLSFVGRLTGPDVFDICTLLGKDVSLKRVQRLLKHLSLSKYLIHEPNNLRSNINNCLTCIFRDICG